MSLFKRGALVGAEEDGPQYFVPSRVLQVRSVDFSMEFLGDSDHPATLYWQASLGVTMPNRPLLGFRSSGR